LPVAVRLFFQDCYDLNNIAHKENKSFIWLVNNVVQSVYKTGLASWGIISSWSYLGEFRELYIDSLLAGQASLGFSFGFFGGIAYNNMEKYPIFKEIYHFKSTETIEKNGLFDFKSNFTKFALNLIVPLVGIKIIPHIISNFLSLFIPNSALIVTAFLSTISAIQGFFFSATRLKENIKLTNQNYRRKGILSKNEVETMKMILPLLPVKLKPSTVENLVSMRPGFARASVICFHLWGTIWSSDFLSKVFLSTLGLMAWTTFRK